MPQAAPKATFAHTPGDVSAALEFLKRTRSELRDLRRVQTAVDWLRVYDVNGDCFEVTGIGYGDAEIVPLLDAINAVFKREAIHEPSARAYKEFKTGKRRCWAEDRLM
ncbi:MAG: hypothetical protein KDA41_08885 [Planctomycetales bacterium]|nr:hypothetical protein [Planctomycetales bacterium]